MGREPVSLRGLLERVVKGVERWQMLDGPSYQVEHGISLAFLLTGRLARPLQDLMHGVWLGHPLSLAHAEHRQIDDQLATVMRTAPDDPEFAAAVRMLESTLRHHTMEEEQRTFPQAQALGQDRLEELGAQLQQRQRELAPSGGMRLIIRLKRATLRLV